MYPVPVSDKVAACFSIFLGGGAGVYTVYGWKKGRINFRGVSTRAQDPFGFWTAVICSGIWAALTAGVGLYILLR